MALPPNTTLTLVTDIKGHSTLIPVPAFPPVPSTSALTPSVVQPQSRTNGHAGTGPSPGPGGTGQRLGTEGLEKIKKEWEEGKCSKERSGELFESLFNHSQSLLSTPPPLQPVPTPLTSLERTLYETQYQQLERQAQLLASRLAKLRRKAVAGDGNSHDVTPPSERERVKGHMVGQFYIPGGWEGGAEGEGKKDGESEERRLRIELKDTQRKLLDAQSQITLLTTSLKSLRSQLLHSTPLIATDITIVSPPPPSPPLSPPRKKRQVTLGDAESEHLILAGKKLSHVTRINRVGLNSAILFQAREIVRAYDDADGGSGGGGGEKITPLEELEERAKEAKRIIAEAEEKKRKRKARGGIGGESEDYDDEDDDTDFMNFMNSRSMNVVSTPKPATPKTPRKGRATPGGGRGSQPQTPKTPNTKKRMIGGVSSTSGPGAGMAAGGGRGGAIGVNLFSSPGGGGFDELLQAAETVLSPGKKGKGKGRLEFGFDDEDEDDHEVTVRKKRRVDVGKGAVVGREREDSSDIEMASTQIATSSPTIAPRTPHSRRSPSSTSPNHPPNHTINTATATGFSFSALDVLADQAFSASQEDGTGTGTGLGSGVGLLSPPPVSQVQRTGSGGSGSGRARGRRGEPSTSDIEEGEGGGWDESDGDGEVVEEEDEEEAKRTRSPYVKWTIEEDELLIQAVIAHGNRWDQVALDVPSRSYHQCRQRWLRGLKSGETIPEELSRYNSDARAAVEQYEKAKKSFRPTESESGS